MKQSLLALALILFTGMAQADLAEKFEENCSTPQNKKLVGTKGSCRIVVVPKKVIKQGACAGLFNKTFPCVISYLSVFKGSMMNLTCGLDLKNPDIDKNMPSETIGYNVSTLIKKDDGSDLVQLDKNEYSIFNGQILQLELTESVDDKMSKVTTGKITIMLDDGPSQLTNVVCK